MDPKQIERLTDAQRASLRLVQQGLSVKEIALRLERAPVTIEKRLEGARKELGVSTSREAARLLAAAEAAGGDYGRSIYGSAALPGDATTDQGMFRPAAEGNGGHEGDSLREDRTAFDYDLTQSAVQPRRAFLIRRQEQRHNDLNRSERLTAIAGLTAAIAGGTALFIITIVLLMDFLIYTSRHGS